MKEHGQKYFRVLVVDDDSSILDLFQQVLSLVGTDRTVHLETGESESKLFKENASNQSLQIFDVVTCQQGDEAVDAMKSSIKEDRPFSVAFIDIRMPPGPDGIWTAEHIRAFDSNIEIVIFTGYLDTHPRDITRRVPPVHKLLYLQKPFHPREIYQFASALSMKWHTECELQRVNKGLEKSVEVQIQKFKESENNFRALAENANDGIILVGSDGKGVYANRKCEEISGYSVTELLRIGVEELFIPTEREILKERFRQRLAGEPVPMRYETKIISKAGKTVPIEVAASRTIWQGHPVALVIFRDIIAQKLMEAGLKREQIKLENRVKERTQELVDTNKALSVLARNIDRKWEAVQKETSKMVNSKILPIIEAFQENKAFTKFRAELNVLQAYLKTLTHVPKTDPGIIFSLSDAELRVATMIKNGLTSPEIARLLNVSEDTVKTHRRNMRKKLKISNSKINLTTYLRSKMR